jgi:NAD(P)-dependent dehydrogenase (short-subunit alcohol dehydrogenase family)
MLAKAGAKVTIFDLQELEGRAHADEIGGAFVKVDVTDEASVDAGFDAAEHRHGVTRLLVNCAGIATWTKTVDREQRPHSIDVFRKIIDINLTGSFLVLSRFAARLAGAEQIGEERGVLINTASIAAFEGQIGQAAYAASKAGIVGMTLPLARELSRHSIRVVTIAPGLFWTPMAEGLEADQDAIGKQVPHPSRFGKPEEFAQLAEAVIRNPMLNGETIRLDGAIRLSPR